MGYNQTFANAITLSAAARAAYNDLTARMPLAPWFPTHSNPGLEWAFDRRVSGLADIAEYREFDAEGTFGHALGAARLSGKIVPIEIKDRLTEFEQAMFWNAGQKNQATSASLIEKVQRGGAAIARRIELARIDALLNGSVTIDENGQFTNINFMRDPSLRATLTGTALWSNAASDPVANIETWMEAVRLVSGVIPQFAIASHDVYNALRVNQSIRNYYYAGMASVGNKVSRTGVLEVLTNETGLLNIVDATTLYAVGELDMANPWPDGKFVLLSSSGPSFGTTEFGVVPMATDSKFGIGASELSGVFARCYDQDNVMGLFTSTQALALPIMPGVNNVFVATVL